MKLQKIVERLQKLHPKEIDLSLDRTKNLLEKLGNPQDQISCISIVGTNGKFSTIQALYAILKEADYKCNIYTSPHIQKINERFVFNNKPLTDDELANLFSEVEEANNQTQITFFEILTVAYFHYAKKYPENINLIESGLFHRFDATNILKKNLASIVTAIGLDHLDWLPKEEQTIEKIIFEKTSTLLNSKIVVAKQSSNEISKSIENTIKDNTSKKIIFNKNYNFTLKENDFFYFEDEFGALKLPKPNLPGEFQLENVSTAIATARQLTEYKITDEHIKSGITKIESIARLQELKSGKLKDLTSNNLLFVDGSHNPLGAKVLNEYLQSLNCNKHIILGMMANKDHNEYMSYFKDIKSLTTIDIPNQPNAIKGSELKGKIKNFENINYKNSIEEAISSIDLQENDIILITGSLYLAGEVLNLN
ncbi:FolC bifunctional protein (Folylpolyglutamatesynthase/Dihydrofolate synthase) [Candidatus Pelagibacter ubique HTCC1002]|uniref:Dihydrofolate synthase/folylpolyglutamate synthase n=1 Tax=Pelagibacter ubique (strain HTCC1002) TaxID=314261 RepID=Q1V1P7_PELU1|nr:Mur ligase family protein [Candidatus Pelagibacter ubique]EAS84831.1 FolC bifunctional protein (Folylpolyglutamatesynthase/Dihydrofolate synthase) [Candidatus Pelagibacter ubique HTCC1002]